MAKNVDALLDEIQQEIKAGRLSEVRPRILEMGRRRRFPRHLVVQLASLARQACLYEETVRLLRPRVIPELGRVSRATDYERGEYGLALASMGSGTEAIQVLSSLDIERAPWIFFGLVLAYFRQWNWVEAIPLIEKYLMTSGRTALEIASAEFDLGIALMHGKDDFKASRDLIERTRKFAEQTGDEALLLSASTVLAQNRFYDGDAKGALEQVSQLEKLHTQNKDFSLGLGLDLIRAESQLLANPNDSALLSEMNVVRRNLQNARFWSRLREIDYGQFQATGDRDILWKMYFGTPFEKAREKFLRVGKVTADDVPDHFDWKVPSKPEAPLSGKGGRPSRLHLFTGENDFSPKARFKEGQVIQRTLQAVVMDLYAPPTSMILFERIYPGESFVPVTSMLKVRQSLWQLRQWFLASKVPLEVVENNGFYWLVASEPTELRIPSLLRVPGGAPVSAGAIDGDQSVAGLLRVQSLAMRAKDQYGTEWFSAPDFASTMLLSERSAQRYLKLGVEQGRFEATGGGAGRRYRVKSGS